MSQNQRRRGQRTKSLVNLAQQTSSGHDQTALTQPEYVSSDSMKGIIYQSQPDVAGEIDLPKLL